MTPPCVDILLSTYNGAAFLEEQFNSLFSQTHENWRLIVRDDGSTDATLDIIDRASKKDSRVIVSESSGKNLGVVGSFICLLQESTSAYFAFCDQDDSWLPNKLETLLGRLESEPATNPVLVYSDLIIADAELKQMFPSFMAQQHFSPDTAAVWPKNLLQNTVVGCACLGNSALKNLVLSNLPGNLSDLVMHDWWISLVASRFGRTIFVPQQTVLYRQHSANQLGAKGAGFWRYVHAIRNERPALKVKRYLERVALQVETFARSYQDILTVDDQELLGMVSKLQYVHGPARSKALIGCYRNGVRMQSPGRDWLVLLASVFG